MQLFTQNTYQEQLNEVIEQLEDRSAVELAVMVYPQSDNYRDTALWLGAMLAFLTLGLVLFLPQEFNPLELQFYPLLAFALGFALAQRLPAVKRALISAKRKHRQTEIFARAIFQKAHIHRTSAHTGVLVYISLLEQEVHVLEDIGVATHLPLEDLEKSKAALQGIFQQANPEQALLKSIEEMIPSFERALPVSENDVNELPNCLDIEL